MEAQFKKYFDILGTKEDVLSDIISKLMDELRERNINYTEYVSTIAVNLFPLEFANSESLKGFNSNTSLTNASDISIIEGVIAKKATQSIFNSLSFDFETITVEELKDRLHGKDYDTELFVFDSNDFINVLEKANIGFVIKSPINDMDCIKAFDKAIALDVAIRSNIYDKKQDYVYELYQKGYDFITDDNVIMTKSGLLSKIIGWARGLYTEKPEKLQGFRSRVVFLNQEVLQKSGYVDLKELSEWEIPESKNADEDIITRVFIKENDYSLDVIIKVVANIESNQFNFDNDSLNNSVASLFNNSEYNCSLLQKPVFQNIGAIKKVNTSYDGIMFTVVKSLLEFKNNNWLLKDYILASKGEVTPFSNFPYLPLGEEIAVGVQPHRLKTDRFDYSGKFCNSGMIMGGAGSGKSALLHSLIVQFLALKGMEGNGSVILMDAKQELPNAWRGIFRSKNIPFYGWDAAPIDGNSAKMQMVRGSKSNPVMNVPNLTQFKAGLFFLYSYQSILNYLLGQNCADKEHIKDFNKSGGFSTVNRMPRTAVIIDEMNVMKNEIGGDELFSYLYDLITGFPRKTRTQGLMWLYCGQDLSKSYIGSDKLSSIDYRIVGSMDSERYEYFNIVENTTIKEYEKKNYSGSGSKPIMSQGSFYAGKTGQTEFVRCLFAGEGSDARRECIDLIEDAGVGMQELDTIVKFALENNLFETFSSISLKSGTCKTNLALVALHEIGIIDDAEFYERTDRIFNGTQQKRTNANIDITRIQAINAKREKESEKLKELEKKSELTESEKEKLKEIKGNIDESDNAISAVIQEIIAKIEKNYNVSIEGIQKEKSGLQGAQTKGKVEDFNSKKDAFLRKLGAAFLVEKEKFISTELPKLLNNLNVEDENICNSVIQYYEEKYTKELEEAKSFCEKTEYIGKLEEPKTDGQKRGVEKTEGDGSPSNLRPPQIQGINTTSDIIKSSIDTGDMEYTGANGARDLNTLEKVSDMIIEDVFNQFGNDIFSIGVNANGGLIVNNTGYVPSFGEAFMKSIQSKPYIVAQLNRGNLSVVADMGYIIRNLMGDSQQLSVEYPRFAKDKYFWNQIGAKNRDCGKLFKKYPNLETINICGEVLTRDNMYEDSPLSGGLLSNLFGLNKNPRVPNPNRKEVDSNSITNRIFSSKPVRIMANAFGWTMGVKAVMLATTIFGPIGLLFGAFAAVGAVKELKNDNQNSKYSTNKPNSNFSRTASNSNRGKQKSNKNRQNRSNGSYNPMTGQSNRSQSRSRSNDDFDGYEE